MRKHQMEKKVEVPENAWSFAVGEVYIINYAAFAKTS